MHRIAESLSRFVFYFGAAILLAMPLLVVVNIFLRAVSGYSIGNVEEIVGYMLVAVTFFGVSITFRAKSLFQVTFLFNSLPASLRKILNRVYLCLIIGFCMVMIWFTSLLVVSSFVRGKVSDTVLHTPLYIPQALIPFGFLIFLVFALEQLFCGDFLGDQDRPSELKEHTGD